MKFVEIYEMYVSMYAPLTSKQDIAGKSVVRDVYLKEWRHALRIRKMSQHTQCKDCCSVRNKYFPFYFPTMPSTQVFLSLDVFGAPFM